jgi:serine/threonine-protein kinase RIM15
MPLHIPPHVRDLKTRRLSEPVIADDFGNFTFKNLPVLEKANKDVIQKLRAEALAAQSKSVHGSPVSSAPNSAFVSPSAGPPSLENSPMIPMPLKRAKSNAMNRPSSPAGFSQANSSPSRQSQPSSPLLVSFSSGGHNGEGRRKTSSNSSSLSQHHAGASFFDQVPRISPGVTQSATVTAATSPMKPRIGAPQLALSPQKIPMAMTTTPGRARSLTVGSQDGSPVTIGELVPHYKQRRSQVFDMSPSSSDNEGDKANQALLRVQRRRQSSRRLSQINFDGGPMFRPLDVLICEDHPVSRMVMEKLLEKLRCRTITVSDGGEATRVAMGDVKFDIILMEFKLPSVNGADVARMIRSTKNINSTTPIVAITGYLKELQQPHFFDALIEKPPTTTKLTEVLCRFCQWKAPALGQTYPPLPSYPVPSALRQEPLRHDDSPSSLSSSIFAQMPGSSFRGSSRGDSIGSSLFEDSEPMIQDDNIPVIISRKATGDWDEHGLGISEDALLEAHDNDTKGAMAPHLLHQHSAPPALGALASAARARSPARVKAKQGKGTEYAESGDDEDEELGSRLVKSRSPTGKQNRGSKLGTEMMRTNSRGSVISGSELTANEADDEISANELSRTSTALTESPEHTNLLDPDDISPGQPISATPARTGDSHRTVSPGAANASSPLTQRLAELSISTPRPNSLTTPRSPFSGPSPALTPPVEEAEFDLSETPKPKSTHDDETTDEEPTPKASDAGLSRSAGPGLGQFDYLSKGEPSLR